MKINKQAVPVTFNYTLNLDDTEYRKLKFCIDYTWHRATKHETPVSCHRGFLENLKNMLIQN